MISYHKRARNGSGNGWGCPMLHGILGQLRRRMDLTLSAIKITKVDFLFGLGFPLNASARHKNVFIWQ